MVEGGFLEALPSKRLVGREEELGQVLGALEAVAGEAGTGRLVLLAGEAGIGKTRLAQEVSVRAWESDFLVASGRCYEAQSGVSFYPFLEALFRLYEQAPEEARGRWPYLEGCCRISSHRGPPRTLPGARKSYRSFCGR